jgi:predicted nucleic acid-binding protein
MSSVLIDSNILLRSVQPLHPQSSLASGAVAELLRQKVDLCLAPQNLVEFWAVATRPVAYNGLEMNPATAAGEIRKMRKIFRLLEGVAGITNAWEKLVATDLVLGKQAHDTNLVAAMLVHDVHRLLTFNGDHFKRFESVEIIVPASVTAGH